VSSGRPGTLTDPMASSYIYLAADAPRRAVNPAWSLHGLSGATPGETRY
jgi:hypothetical protein